MDDLGTSSRRGTADVKIAGRAGRCKSWHTNIQTYGTPTIDFENTLMWKLLMDLRTYELETSFERSQGYKFI